MRAGIRAGCGSTQISDLPFKCTIPRGKAANPVTGNIAKGFSTAQSFRSERQKWPLAVRAWLIYFSNSQWKSSAHTLRRQTIKLILGILLFMLD
jgi:hypothetical protein